MKNIRKLIALTTAMALCASQVQAQDCGDCACVDDSAAYYDCGKASYWSAAIPIGAIVVAAIIIASTSGGGGHKHSSSSNGGGKHHRHPRPNPSSSSSYTSGGSSSSSSSSSGSYSSCYCGPCSSSYGSYSSYSSYYDPSYSYSSSISH